MMTLSLGQDVSKCVFVYFGVISQKKTMSKSQPKKIHARASHPQMSCIVVFADPYHVLNL